MLRPMTFAEAVGTLEIAVERGIEPYRVRMWRDKYGAWKVRVQLTRDGTAFADVDEVVVVGREVPVEPTSG